MDIVPHTTPIITVWQYFSVDYCILFGTSDDGYTTKQLTESFVMVAGRRSGWVPPQRTFIHYRVVVVVW